MADRGDAKAICSVSGAINVLQWLETDETFISKKEWPFHKFPFGLWFRGHSRIERELLEPRVFRKTLPMSLDPEQRDGMWDESNVYEHLKVRVPSHEHVYRSAFDWLCLMQHYSVPTRLLDWSESILVALYFATKENPDENGELIMLNAYRLNQESRRSRRHASATIATPDTCHVVVRAEMAATRSSDRLARKKNVRTALQEEGMPLPKRGWLNAFTMPLAVFPRRLNDRMILQSSVFTLHGGKKYVNNAMKERYGKELIPEPTGLDEMNVGRADDTAILKRYEIPHGKKKEILRDLFRMGIHEGTLFPEVDRQAVLLQQLWWFPSEPLS